MDSAGNKIEQLSGKCIPIRGNDIDTDRIIPARYMKVVSFKGLGEFVFYDERFSSDGKKKNHPFNMEKYEGASILIVNKNFGCGSSREHAPQSLYRYGIHAVIGESFAEIFEGNCGSMGIPVLTMDAEDIEELMTLSEKYPESKMILDIKSSEISYNGKKYSACIRDSSRSSLLAGTWDSMASLLGAKEAIISKTGELPYFKSFNG